MQRVFGLKRPNQPKQWVWFQGHVKARLCTLGAHGALQIRIWWQALPEKEETFELWDDRLIIRASRQVDRKTEAYSLGCFSVGDSAANSGEDDSCQNKKRSNANVAGGGLLGRRFESRSAGDGDGATNNSGPTGIRTVDLHSTVGFFPFNHCLFWSMWVSPLLEPF